MRCDVGGWVEWVECLCRMPVSNARVRTVAPFEDGLEESEAALEAKRPRSGGPPTIRFELPQGAQPR
jgi:hypothetical protein